MFDGIKRHWEVAKEALRQEKANASRRLPIHQRDFLPAALAVMEKPASPAGRFIIWLIVGFFCIAIGWAIFGKIDVVATAPGQIVPQGQTKVVQSFQPGLVLDIRVENGSQVAAGDILIELDATTSSADLARLKNEQQTASIKQARNQWLLVQLETLTRGDTPADPQQPGFDLPASVSEPIEAVQRLLAQSQLNEYRAVQSAYQQQREEKHSELSVVTRQLDKLNETLPLLEEQVTGMEELSGKGVTARFQFLEYQERLVTRRQDITIEQDRILQVKAGIRSLEKQREQHRQAFRKQVVTELADATSTLAAIEQELKKAEQTHKLQRLRAPVSGVVQQLAVHTIGGVVPAGDPLMIIVPADRQLQVEANILNKDIGFVAEGQTVEVKLEAFPFTKYGVIHGVVESIDLAAVQDENLGLIYPARIAIEQSTMIVNGKQIPLATGMALTAELKTGKRRLIEFLLSPLLRYKDESLRER